MPEGHSLRRLALSFEQWFVGSKCLLTSPQGRFTKGAALLNGRRMSESVSVGKHLFLRFDQESSGDPLWLHVHLGLYGAWRFHSANGTDIAASIGAPRTIESDRSSMKSPNPDSLAPDWEPPAPKGAVRVRINTGTHVGDLNGPNQCEVLNEAEVQGVLSRLGPDPLGKDARLPGTVEQFVSRVRASKRSIGELVMDQSVIAGVGNIYRAEGLFRQGISPMRKGSSVSVGRLQDLWHDYVVLLESGVRTGKILTVRKDDLPDEDSPEMELALENDPESLRWYVYHRTGRPCLTCSSPIQEKVVQGRRLFWCSKCQR